MKTPIHAILAAMLCLAAPCRCQEPLGPRRAPLPQALSDEEFARVLEAVDRGLASIARQQLADGAIATGKTPKGQPAITALAAMALLSRGHTPGAGPYGATLDRAIDFTLSCQKPNGLLSWGGELSDGAYNHAIALLMLGEACGLTTGERSTRMRVGIERGIAFSHWLWSAGRKPPGERGGFRYLKDLNDSDLSVTGWFALAYRSLRNAGFDIPKDVMDGISIYVLGCYAPATQSFGYTTGGIRPSLAMTGAGVLCLSLAGKAESFQVQAAIETLTVANYERGLGHWPLYGCYYASQAAAQAGGQHWRIIYRKLVGVLLPWQRADGVWPGSEGDADFGEVYPTALVVLALTPQLQLLPIYQH